jgi:translation initiation factor IF-2
MTDTDPSGATFAPVADSSAPAASAETAAGNFGSTRGSGLARGKRPSGAASPAASTAKSDYKPTAVEIITPAREYKNPFASPEPVNAPAFEPAKVEAPTAVVMEEPKAEAPAEVPASVPEPVAEKQEIEILPPAETARPSVSWEAHSDLPERTHQDARPTFRADRREDVAGEPRPEGREPRSDSRDPRRDSFQRQPRDPREARQPRDPREARQPRDPRDERQPRDPRDARQPRDPREARQPRDPRDEQPSRNQNGSGEQGSPAVKPSTGGFLGWLKGLFGGKKPEEAPVGRESRGEHEFRGGERHRRRRRGGRGHGGNPQSFAGDRSSQGGPRPEGFQGERDSRGGDRHGGHGRGRHRGGRGRDRGGDPRPEGHQGGGAI